MSVNAVFVYADRQVGLMALPSELPTWRLPKIKPMSFAAVEPEDITAPTFEVEEFARRGKMFDGRPVYVSDGFDVKEARMSVKTRDYVPDFERLDDHLRREVEHLVFSEYPRAIPLDCQCGEAPLPEWEKEALRLQCLTERWYRLLVAVPK